MFFSGYVDGNGCAVTSKLCEANRVKPLALQSARVLIWALALLAVVQPALAQLCWCNCRQSATPSACCDHGICSKHDACTATCCDQGSDAPALAGGKREIGEPAPAGLKPCQCPPTCECRLRRSSQSTPLNDVPRRPVLDASVGFLVEASPLGQPPATASFQCSATRAVVSGALCCAVLCRFVI